MEQPSLRPPCIRPMAPADAAALTALWVASWRDAMPAIDFGARRGWLAALLADPAIDTLVAEANAPLGFASLRREPRGTVLEQITVAPGAKGGGVARALMAAAKAGATEALTLEVNQANARALGFYAREGFTRTGAGRNPNSGLATWRMAWHPTASRNP